MPRFIPRERRRLLTDFATLYSQLWYRDFPTHPRFRTYAHRADWTRHIGLTMRAAADLMGLFTRFESGGQTDGILRDNADQPIAALEWEWQALNKDPEINEFNKLRQLGCRDGFCDMAFVALIGYVKHSSSQAGINYTQRWREKLEDFTRRWDSQLPPLLLIGVHFVWKGKYRAFSRMTFHRLEKGAKRRLRNQRAYPWDVKGTRWELETDRNRS